MQLERNRTLYRSRSDRKIAGVAGGLAEYFDTDPNLVRAILVVGLLATTGPLAPLFYLLLMLIIPRDPTVDGLERPSTRHTAAITAQ